MRDADAIERVAADAFAFDAAAAADTPCFADATLMPLFKMFSVAAAIDTLPIAFDMRCHCRCRRFDMLICR